jgi:TetR/AcrR family transcriptional regulator of autoinduction and epiphytic fitness
MSETNEKKNCIVKAAMAEFLEKGLGKASMQAISDAAQVSKRTLYKYFPNKESLFESLVIGLCSKHEMPVDHYDYNTDSKFNSQVEKIIESDLQVMLHPEYLKLTRLIMSELLKQRPLNPEIFEKFKEKDEPFLNWIQAAQKDNNIRKDMTPVQILELYRSFFKGTILLPQLLGYAEDLEYLRKENYKKILTDYFLRNFES